MTQASAFPSRRESASKRLNEVISKYYPTLERMAAGEGSGHSLPLPSTPARLGAALQGLQRGLTGERLLAGASYFSSPEYRGAYLLYYWPVSFVQVSLALEEIRLRGAMPRLRSVLDLGAGPGPASFAALERGAERITLMDTSEEALKAARRLMENLPGAEAELSAIRRDFEEDDSLEGGPYDLIVACHSVNELWKGRADAMGRRRALLENAIARLSEGGILLVIEPSALVTCRPALALRDLLLENAERRGLSCVAPCPGSFPCPIAAAGEGRGCHSTWPWQPSGPVAALAKAAGLDRDSAKATWFALRKGPAAPAQPDSPPPVPATLAGRIISEPMLNKAGRVRYIVCTASGLATLSAKAADPLARSLGFLSLGRGDLIEARGLEKRSEGNGFGLMPGTTVGLSLKSPEA